MGSVRQGFIWDDPLLLEDQLSEEERMIRDTARDYAQDKLQPRVLLANREEHFDREITPYRKSLVKLSYDTFRKLKIVEKPANEVMLENISTEQEIDILSNMAPVILSELIATEKATRHD